jgi:hypothetical protein
MIPNDKNERLKFLKEMHKLRRFEREHLYVKKLQDLKALPYIDIPEVMHTEDHGDLVFRIDKENGTIRILRRIYEWDSDKDNIDDE